MGLAGQTNVHDALDLHVFYNNIALSLSLLMCHKKGGGAGAVMQEHVSDVSPGTHLKST